MVWKSVGANANGALYFWGPRTPFLMVRRNNNTADTVNSPPVGRGPVPHPIRGEGCSPTGRRRVLCPDAPPRTRGRRPRSTPLESALLPAPGFPNQ